jgi:L-histidine Nalpha-methyltransferase
MRSRRAARTRERPSHWSRVGLNPYHPFTPARNPPSGRGEPIHVCVMPAQSGQPPVLPNVGSHTMRGFASADHERAFFAALACRHVPVKFAYAGDAAATHNRLASGETYHAVVGPGRLDADALLSALSAPRVPTQVCDIGPGNGVNTVQFLRALTEAGVSVGRYLGLDFSKALMDVASGRIPRDLVADTAWGIWDFETSPTTSIKAWATDRPVLAALGGITLGNAESPSAALENIRLSLRRGDVLLVTLAHAGTRADDPLDGYLSPLFEASVLEPLLMAGIERSRGRLEMNVSKDGARIIGEFVFTDAQALDTLYGKVAFRPGDRIRCFLSRRFSEQQIQELVARSAMRLKSRISDLAPGHVVLLFER